MLLAALCLTMDESDDYIGESKCTELGKLKQLKQTKYQMS
jgi:hypothetical protein